MQREPVSGRWRIGIDHIYGNLCIFIIFIFFSYYIIFKILYKFWYIFFYTINIFVYLYHIHIIFRIILYFYFFYILYLYHIIILYPTLSFILHFPLPLFISRRLIVCPCHILLPLPSINLVTAQMAQCNWLEQL